MLLIIAAGLGLGLGLRNGFIDFELALSAWTRLSWCGLGHISLRLSQAAKVNFES